MFISRCASNPIDRIDNGLILLDWQLIKDENLLGEITNYQNNELSNGVGIPFVIIKRKNIAKENVSEYIISSHKNLSWLFNWPFTSYFIHNGKPVLVYFQNGPFMNPKNYPKHVVQNLFAVNSYNNWNRYYDADKKEVIKFSSLRIHHPEIWKFKNNKKTINPSTNKSLAELLYGEEDFLYSSYYNLDNFRTDYSDLKSNIGKE